MGKKKNRRHDSATATQPVRDIGEGSEVRFETVLNDVYLDGRRKTLHVAAAGIVQAMMSAQEAWELDLISGRRRSGTVLKILIPAKTPMVDLRSGERFAGLPLPTVVYKHKSRVDEIA